MCSAWLLPTDSRMRNDCFMSHQHVDGATACLSRGATALLRVLHSASSAAALVCCLLIAQPSGTIAAQGGSDPDSSARDSIEAPPVSPSSPRAALEEFIRLTRASRYAEAARYLDVPSSASDDAITLVRELKAVLDRWLWIDLDQVSGAPAGDTADGLPPGVETIGVIVDPGGGRAPVRLTRSPKGEVPWRFSRATVQRIPSWYAMLPDRWMLEHLPGALLRPGPVELLWWQWAALPLLLAVVSVVGWLLSRLLRGVLARLAARTATTWDNVVLERLGTPLTAALTLGVLAAAVPWLSLYRPALDVMLRGVRVGSYVILFWSLWRLVDVGRQLLARSAWAHASRSSRALLPLAGRIAKVGVVAVAVVAVLSMLGFPVASLVAGLGIGGLALALAAQKTVENLFGAFSISIDQPFREGDFVKVEEFVGTVEAIGLRSTRFRTLDRTVITIPNGKLADMRLESFAVRDRLRLATVVGLVHETTAAQLRDVLHGFERVLRANPKLWPDDLTVRFVALSGSSLDIEVVAWFTTANWGEFQAIRQEILLQFIEIVEQAGTAFARPTQTVHIGSAPPLSIERSSLAETHADG
jgi:MscS family membrane protein